MRPAEAAGGEGAGAAGGGASVVRGDRSAGGLAAAGLSEGAIMVAGPTTSAVFVSASVVPSTPTRWMVISERPETPAGTTAFKAGKPNSGTAHEPGAIAYPSVSETLAGSPRKRTKVLPGKVPGGPT